MYCGLRIDPGLSISNRPIDDTTRRAGRVARARARRRREGGVGVGARVHGRGREAAHVRYYPGICVHRGGRNREEEEEMKTRACERALRLLRLLQLPRGSRRSGRRSCAAALHGSSGV